MDNAVGKFSKRVELVEDNTLQSNVRNLETELQQLKGEVASRPISFA
jgi:hypothetical protein